MDQATKELSKESYRPRNGGIWAYRPRYSQEAEAIARRAIALRRPTVPLDPDTKRGIRFNSTDDVFIRLESMRSVDEFLVNVVEAVDAALNDAAAADYFYEYEGENDGPDCEVIECASD